MHGKVTAQFSLRGGMSNLIEKCSNFSQARMRSSTKKCDPRGGHYVGKNDLRHAGIGYRDDEPAPHGKCGALLALVFPIWRGHGLRSRLRIQQLGAVHGDRPWHRRLLLHQSVRSAAGTVRAICKVASPHGGAITIVVAGRSPATTPGSRAATQEEEPMLARMIFAVLALTTVPMIQPHAANAAPYWPWCSQYFSRGTPHACAFVSWEQCMDTVRG